MTSDPMSPRSLLSAVEFDRAAEIVELLCTSDDVDAMADAMEDAAQGGELTHAILFRLWCRVRGIPDESGVELVGMRPTAASLILPPGVQRGP